MAADLPVIVFGDSLAHGVAGAIAALHRSVTDFGIVGWGLYHPDLASRTASLSGADYSGGVALLSIGTNDAPTGTLPSEDYTGRLRTLRSAIPHGVRVVWLLPPSGCGRPLAHDAIGPLVSKVAREHGDGVLDASTCNPTLRAADGIHFTARGYQNVATRLLQAAK